MITTTEKKLPRILGLVALLFDLVLLTASVWLFIVSIPGMEENTVPNAGFFVAMGIFLVFAFTKGGYFIIHPNEAKVFTFLGKYIGSESEPGFFFTNPFTTRKTVELRVRNFASDTIKVNDAMGNPIEIGAVVVWKVTDSARAVFDATNYEDFVSVQSETAIRTLASHYPYDHHDAYTESLRGQPDAIALFLKKELQERLAIVGVTVDEARISHLAYAPEIAQVMLRRQQAEAIIAARRLIVDGAVGMVEMALSSLEKQGVVKLDEEKKASMVNNLLVALVSEREAQPVINTGSLYT